MKNFNQYSRVPTQNWQTGYYLNLRLTCHHCAGPVQQNSFNLTTNNMEILTVQLRQGVPKHKQLLFTRKNASSMKQADFSNMFKNASKTVCTSNAVVSPDPLPPTSSTSSAMKTPEHTKQDRDNPEPADKGDVSSATILQPVVQSK